MHTTLALLAARTIATNAAPSTNPFTCGTATPRTPVRAQHSDGQNVTAHKIAHLATTPSFGFHDRTRSPRFSIHRPPKCPPLPQAWFRCGSAKLAAESQDLPLLVLVRVRFRSQYFPLLPAESLVRWTLLWPLNQTLRSDPSRIPQVLALPLKTSSSFD